MSACDWCGRQRPLREGLCFGCRIRTVRFGFQGGRAEWNGDQTYTAQAKEIEDSAREKGMDIAKVK